MTIAAGTYTIRDVREFRRLMREPRIAELKLLAAETAIAALLDEGDREEKTK